MSIGSDNFKLEFSDTYFLDFLMIEVLVAKQYPQCYNQVKFPRSCHHFEMRPKYQSQQWQQINNQLSWSCQKLDSISTINVINQHYYYFLFRLMTFMLAFIRYEICIINWNLIFLLGVKRKCCINSKKRQKLGTLAKLTGLQVIALIGVEKWPCCWKLGILAIHSVSCYCCSSKVICMSIPSNDVVKVLGCLQDVAQSNF